jgi:poly-gamma-glutamate capsule biosynthesis protein CapA/YwtB (metallophosphatase superfamily)
MFFLTDWMILHWPYEAIMTRFKSVFPFAIVLSISLASITSAFGKQHHAPRMPFSLDACDTLFTVTAYPVGDSLRLIWANVPGVDSWNVYRATNPDFSDMELVATIHGATQWHESAAFMASHLRAYYHVTAHWNQGSDDNFSLIEGFDSAFTLQSYSAAEDSDADAWRVVADGAFNPFSGCLELYGNTWKKEQIDTVRVDSGTIWQVAMKSMHIGDLQAFGVADSANELWYPIWGPRLQNSQAWNVTYQGWYPDSQWVLVDLPIAEDWLGRFGYYPLISQLMFANDNDDSGSAGVLRIDEIRDVTGTISMPPRARFIWHITGYPVPDTMEVAFCSMGCDPEGPIYREQWSFGDGTMSLQNSPTHRYAAHGTYAVTLAVQDTSNRTDFVMHQVSDTTFTATHHISTIFTGDVMMARRYTGNGSIIATWGVDSIFGRVRPLLAPFDLAMCNLECPFTLSNQHHPTKTYYFKGRPEYVEGLKFAGFDFCALGNNHNFDYLVPGMHDTKYQLDSLLILSTGAGDNDEIARQPAFFSKNGLTVAILSFCNRDGTEDRAEPYLEAGPAKPGFAMWNRENIEQTIPAARQVADVVIVQVHSGIEYANTPPSLALAQSLDLDDDNTPPVILDLLPDTSDVALRKYAIDMGADLVVNHHPHVMEGCEVYDGRLIAHSMGNFAFDQELPETFVTMAIEASLADNHSVGGFVVHPIYIDHYIPGVATGALSGAILDYQADLARALHTWVLRAPYAETGFVVMDTSAVHRVGENRSDTLTLADRDSFAYSAPFLLNGGGYPVSVALNAPAGSQFRVGRELLMWGNIEAEGATPWNLNSTHERYDTTTYHAGHRSLGFDRGGGGTNSVSTNLVYRQVYPLGSNCTIAGWMRATNGRDVTLQFEFYDARTGGHFRDSIAVGGAQSGTFGWTRVWQDLLPPNDGYCYDIKARLLSPTSGTGYAWFDDLALVQWEDWHTVSADVPFPSNIGYVQVRAPLGTTSAVVTYRREWVNPPLTVSPVNNSAVR